MRCVFALASAWAAPFGFQPNSWATCSTLARVPSETPGLPLRAYETALLETPDALATSKIVTLFFELAYPHLLFAEIELKRFTYIIQQRRHQPPQEASAYGTLLRRVGGAFT